MNINETNMSIGQDAIMIEIELECAWLVWSMYFRTNLIPLWVEPRLNYGDNEDYLE